MAGERNAEPAPWQRAARQGDDGRYGGQASGGRGGYDSDPGYGDGPGYDDPRRARGPVPPQRASAMPAAPVWSADDDDDMQGSGPRSRGGDRGDRGGARGERGGGRGGSGRGGAGKTGGGRFGPKTIVVVSAVSLLGTVAGAGAFTYNHFNSAIQTAADAGLNDASRPAEAAANAAGQYPINILLVGSDARDNGNSEYGTGQAGQGARSDTTILLHVYADHQHAVGISIPRDLLVNIPACLYDQSKPNGKKSAPQHNQFNAAFAIGDTPQGNIVCTRDTVEQMSGIRIDHTITVGFAAFAKLTDAIGGVEVCVPKDVPSIEGDNITLKKGIQTLSGRDALNYVRKREGLGDGSDISRTRRQQAFLGSMIKKMQSDGVLNDATKLSAILNDGIQYATFDKELGSLGALSDFANSVKAIKPANIQFMTLPGHYAGARVEMDPVSAKVIWDHLKSDTLLDGTNSAGNAGATASPTTAPTTSAPPPPTNIPPASIAVKIQNGTSTTGLAATVTDMLLAQGYDTTLLHTSPPDTAVTLITYNTSKQEAAAQQLAAQFPGAKVSQSSRTTGIVITVGADYAAAHPKATPGTSPGSTSGGDSGSPLPSAITNNSRTADDNICSGISNGFGAGTG